LAHHPALKSASEKVSPDFSPSPSSSVEIQHFEDEDENEYDDDWDKTFKNHDSRKAFP